MIQTPAKKTDVHPMRRLMNYVLSISCIFIMALVDAPIAISAPNGLEPWGKNPWYWSYRGDPVLLLGASDDDNLFQWSEKELAAQLDRLTAAGGNVIRNTVSDRKDKGFEVFPFRQLENGKYDLNAWNEEYWARFERLLKETAKRRIFIQIEVWDRFDYTDSKGCNHWQIHPYNPKNNVNYSYDQSGFAEHYPDHPGANKQPFFFTTPNQKNNIAVLPFQKKFVEKLLESSLRYDHVLYCIDNETRGEEEWGKYWARFIRDKASNLKKKIYVTEMWDDWDLTSDMHKRTFDHPDIYDFVDVSQNNHNKGQGHWDNFIHVRKYLEKSPRPMNTTKIYGADSYKGNTDQDGIDRFWRHLLAGAASLRFHRPGAGLGLNDKAVACIRAARKLESKIPLWNLKPANDLLSDREPDEAYLAANPGKAYTLYFPDGGNVRVDFSGAKRELNVYWIDVSKGEWGKSQSIPVEGKPTISPPGEGPWAAAIIINGF
ncbi:hypothetical protein JW926_17675 [Candidatus Sumerlaeota bacterium]|nr:hypothetical protein [Candidatus Sumerlaeota bacterium]